MEGNDPELRVVVMPSEMSPLFLSELRPLLARAPSQGLLDIDILITRPLDYHGSVTYLVEYQAYKKVGKGTLEKEG